MTTIKAYSLPAVQLHYGSPQILVAIIYLMIVLALVVVFASVAANASSAMSLERIQSVGYWIRRRWLASLAALLVVVVGASWAALPYARGSGADRTVVQVTAGQFFWAFNPPRVPVGTPVRFEITSRDVNHGFGLYGPEGQLVTQAQAMPGYTNNLDYTFTRAGEYPVRCLEFCGVDHHLMASVFTVLPAGHP